jgi:hypothetical protein
MKVILVMRNPGKWSSLWILSAILVGIAGCGDGVDRPELGKVTGQVTMDGEPFADVIIRFQPEEGRASTARLDAEGNYELMYVEGVKGAKVGTHTVTFEWPIGKEGKGIPKKYAANSELQREVEPGKNNFDFELESAGEEMAPVVD